MGLFDSFTGASQRRDIGYGNQEYNSFLKKGRENALGALNQGKTEALGYYQPYSQMGQQGRQDFDLYRKAIGLEGADGYGEAYDVFEADPFREYRNQNVGNVLRDSFRRYNAGGMADSGVNRLAQARIGAEYAQNDVDDFRNRLSGAGQYGTQIGFNADNAMAGVTQNEAAQRAGIETSIASARGNQAINYGNALAGSRTIGLNNFMGLVGAGTNALAAYNGIPRKVA